MAQGTIAHNKRIKKAMNEMVRDMDAEYFVTLNFNRDTNYEAARKALRAWHARVDKALLGGSWSRKARNERTFFIACVEHLDSNIHWHVMLRLGESTTTQRFEAVAEQCWEKAGRERQLGIAALGDRLGKCEEGALHGERLVAAESD